MSTGDAVVQLMVRVHISLPTKVGFKSVALLVVRPTFTVLGLPSDLLEQVQGAG